MAGVPPGAAPRRRRGHRKIMLYGFHVLHRDRYAARRSKLVPKLDPDLIARCIEVRTQTAAVRMLRAALRKR